MALLSTNQAVATSSSAVPRGVEPWIEAFERQAARAPARLALEEQGGPDEGRRLTYAELHREVTALAGRVARLAPPGARVLVVCPPGIPFVAAFLACLTARVLPVALPAPHPARARRFLDRVEPVLTVAEPTLGLAPSATCKTIRALAPVGSGLARLGWAPVDGDDAEATSHASGSVEAADLAFLQFTSGSTTAPRGVMVTHAGLVANVAAIAQAFDLDEASHVVTWLPPTHDMGLVGGLLAPLGVGASVTILPTSEFLLHPIRWLEAVSRSRASTSGGPSFAYDLCVRRTRPEQRARLDLSTWRVAFNGAEQVDPDVMSRFGDAFAPCGFRHASFVPCYGLAEATLLVSGGPVGQAPLARSYLRQALRQGRAVPCARSDPDARALVPCGRPAHDVRIVHPETRTACSIGEVGEIWVGGPSVAAGYWRQVEATQEAFDVRTEPDVGRGFLRTGDLGFLEGGEVVVTGRRKDLIVVDGQNHDPCDLEASVQAADPLLHAVGCAAFQVEAQPGGQLVVVVELGRHVAARELLAGAVRSALAERHGLAAADVRFVSRGAIPRTTSGKVRRFACRDAYLAGTLGGEGSA